MNAGQRPRKSSAALAVCLLISGCSGASIHEVARDPQQDRMERLLIEILPYTNAPHKHYWVRVAEPTKHRVGLTVLHHRHIYLAKDLLEAADDGIVRALLANGVAHHRLKHHTTGDVRSMTQRAAFKVGGFFVPGLSHGYRITNPLGEAALRAGQERGADKQAVEYLMAAGYSKDDLIRAFQFMVDHDYAKRIGRIVLSSHELTRRIGYLQRLDASALSD